MKNLLFAVALCAFTLPSFAQFEGTVDFVKTKGKINVNYTYKIKSGQIRIEEFGDDDKLDGIQLVNTNDGTIYALSPERKMYMEAKNKRPQRTAVVDVKKTKTTKTINGKSCVKWIVTCSEQERKIIYWVTKGNYDFFIPFLRTLNRAEKSAIYFLMIEGNENYFPILAEEYNSDGLLISKLEAKDVSSKKLSQTNFNIPEGYKKFER
ncbi:MAG: DUF4412 domain-containing protein [Flavobacteriales bacterium]|nr:DUF4412 domain-containing protein [Flavobacteriales bacterium]